ncbi:MAG TPA: hypothetical protein VHC41_01580 [Mycobacteriales bacterium]|nr:hypothetical protein [Mycobacteriales bacterium]
MDRRTGIARLPGVYGFALFLRDSGLDDGEIAIRVGVDLSAAANLLALAEAKLAALLAGACDPQQSSNRIS